MIESLLTQYASIYCGFGSVNLAPDAVVADVVEVLAQGGNIRKHLEFLEKRILVLFRKAEGTTDPSLQEILLEQVSFMKSLQMGLEAKIEQNFLEML